MSTNLFPKEIIDNSAEANFSKHSIQTKLIYLTVLGAVVVLLVALPLIKVTVSIRSQGVIKPLTDRNQLVSLVSGKISKLYIKENSSVVRGQVVAKISAPVLQEQNQFNRKRQQKINKYLTDLNRLLNMKASRILASFSISKNNASSSPLRPFSRRILQAMQEIEAIPEQSLSDSSTGLIYAGKNDTALQKGRQKLLTLLNIDASSLLNTKLEDHNPYKDAFLQFKKVVAPLQNDIKKAQKDVSRRKLLNSHGIISDKEYAQSRAKLKSAWDHLLTSLHNEFLPILNAAEPDPGNHLRDTPDIQLKTAKYKSSLLQFKQQVRNNIQEIELAQQKFNRNKKLYQRSVISEATYEKSSFALKSARNDFQLLFEQQQNKWQADRVQYRDELDKLNTDQQKMEKKKDKYVLRAPISGTIQNMRGIYEGSPVSPNQPLAEISPDTALIAECYVPPKDIGLLRKGMKARFQVSAFDYNQWGLLTGKISDISNDVTVINNQPVFKVRCVLDKTWLELKNGYKGELKKGMSLQARFKVTRRSLFQLLYDNLDDWLNPQWNKDNATTQKAAM